MVYHMKLIVILIHARGKIVMYYWNTKKIRRPDIIIYHIFNVCACLEEFHEGSQNTAFNVKSLSAITYNWTFFN